MPALAVGRTAPLYVQGGPAGEGFRFSQALERPGRYGGTGSWRLGDGDGEGHQDDGEFPSWDDWVVGWCRSSYVSPVVSLRTRFIPITEQTWRSVLQLLL